MSSADNAGAGVTPAVSPAAWGTAPCPLAPLPYRNAYEGSPVLPELAAAAGQPALTLADLDSSVWSRLPWPELPPDLFRRHRQQLAWFAVPRGIMILPGGDRNWLLGLPLRTRARNVMRRMILGAEEAGTATRPLSGDDVLMAKSAGKITLLDLLCVLEGVSELPEPMRSQVTGAGFASPSHESVTGLVPASDDAGGFWRRELDFEGLNLEGLGTFRDLLAAAQEVLGARTLQDVVVADLGKLAAATGTREELADVDLAAITGGKRLSQDLLDGIADLRADADPRDILILEARLYRRNPTTLEALGQRLGITRERVRQIESKIRRRLAQRTGRPVRILAGALTFKLDPVLPIDELDAEIAALMGDPLDPDAAVACRIVREALGYVERGGFGLSPQAVEVVDELKERAERFSDDAGLFDEEALRGALPDADWNRHLPLLIRLCGFHRIGRWLGLRNSQKALVKATVLDIGRIATKTEIAKRCGLPVQRTTSHLSMLESVVRADPIRWGLSEWIEDAYDGVAGEIHQRIEEDGGATRVDRLFEELPRLFGVKETTIRAYLSTRQFVVEDGLVREVAPDALRMRPLDEVAHGRDEQGRPFFVFRVGRHYFDGYGLPGVPPEIAVALGCKPNSRHRVPVRRPEGCGPVSVNWKLASLSGANVGYLAEPLRRLGARPGDPVRLILCDSNSVELEFHDPQRETAPDDGAAQRGTAPAEAALARMKNRRRVL